MQTQWQELKTRVAAITNDATARPKRYDNIDGTGEMFFGLMILGFALLGWLQSILPTHSVWKTNPLLSLLFTYLVLGPILGLGFLGQKWVKRRFTWRRTGYVALGLPGTGGQPGQLGVPKIKAKTRQWAGLVFFIGLPAAVVGAVVAGLFACLFAFEMKHPDVLPLVRLGDVFYLGLWVVIYAFWIRCMGKGHAWKWGMLLLMAAGLLVIGIHGGGDSFETQAHPVTLLVGSVWFLSGLITLVLYLRHNPPPAPETE